MRVKICGITRPEDGKLCEQAGVDAIGLNFFRHSKRYVTLAQAQAICAVVGPFITRVGVFVDSPVEDVLGMARALHLHAIQLHGQEDSNYIQTVANEFSVIKAISFHAAMDASDLKTLAVDGLLFDGLRPGSGESFDWNSASGFKNWPNLILAGGLTPDNVVSGIQALRPYAVDAASGVESSPGIKDARKVQDFVRLAKQAALS